MIYTSYFGNRNIPDHILKVAICRYTPKHFTGVHYPILSPSPTILESFKSHNIGYSEFTQQFIHELDSKPIESILQNLLSFESDIVLLCYEGKDQFCHRHIISFYAKYHFNIDIIEI